MRDAPFDDGDVLASAAAGEEWALTVLYRRHQPDLVRFLSALAGGEADDVAAESWIDAARALPRFTGDDRGFRSLLFTIARRRAVDRARARHRRRTDPADPATLVQPDGQPDVGEQVVEADASRVAVDRIRALLPRDQAEVVLLRVVAGLSVGEVAEVVGRTRASVSVLQTRGLQRLARQLGAERRRSGRTERSSPQAAAESPVAGKNVQDPRASERWDD